MATQYQLQHRIQHLEAQVAARRALAAIGIGADIVSLPKPDANIMRLMLRQLVEAGALLPSDADGTAASPSLREKLLPLLSQVLPLEALKPEVSSVDDWEEGEMADG